MQVRRGFVDVTHGQLHYRSCGDPGLPVLVMMHGSPGSSFSLLPLARHLGAQRHVIALDTAGNGDSAPLPQGKPEIADLAVAAWQAIEALGLATADLYGYHTGTGICTEIAIAHPARIRRIVMDGLSVFDPSESAMLLARNHAPPIPLDHEGSQFAAAWTMVRDAHIFWPWWNREAGALRGLGLPPAAYLHGEALEVLKACGTYHRSYEAALRYPKRARLKLLRHKVLVTACPSDQLYSHLDTGADLIAGSQRVVSPERSPDAGPAARMMLDFLLAEE